MGMPIKKYIGNIIDLTGFVVGRLTVCSYVESRPSYGGRNMPYWDCVCLCGNRKEVSSKSLRAGTTESCGCLKIESGKYRVMLPFGESTFNKLYDTIKGNAKKKGHLFQLSIDEFKGIITKDCIYCGQPPTEKYFKKHNGYFLANGVDRFDNSIGYTINNSVPCCEKCNRMKMAHSIDKWMSHMIRVLENYKKEVKINEHG